MAVSEVYVDSSVIESIEHDDYEDSVTIHFNNGSSAKYYEVDRKKFLDFVSADSPGRFYNSVIKQKPTRPQSRLMPGQRVRLKAATVNGTGEVVQVFGDTAVVKVTVGKEFVEKV